MSKKVEQSGPKMGSTVLRTDTCVSPFQDKQFGRGVRAWNVGKGKLRCTACGREAIS